ncbi:Chaperone DnaJ-domain superfamily protein [Euphorbia peplus]|nr:Chaperone DnaJ-domain superfamily protein [Euphorbia peplus]
MVNIIGRVRWGRSLLILKNSFVPTSSSISHYASIHSTTPTLHKSKPEGRGSQQPPKNHARFVVRQKRADAKKALKGIIFGSLSSKASFQDEMPKWEFDPESMHGTDKKKKPKPSARHHGKSHNKKMKRKFRKESFPEDSDDPETIFQATFGNRWYTWSHNHSHFRSSNAFGHDWREQPRRKSHRDEEWDATSERESYDESFSIGSSHDRTILGLPPKGPLNIKDVKDAFRISALKWHPDKHQGHSQEMAEEKFKVCVSAYKSLCDALSGV